MFIHNIFNFQQYRLVTGIKPLSKIQNTPSKIKICNNNALLVETDPTEARNS